jgi:hypothetical protein
MGARAVTAANDIERDLRARYRQPAGVEQFGIEPVPEERKTVGWFDLFSIMFNFLINPGTMLSGGMMVAAGLSFQAAIADLGRAQSASWRRHLWEKMASMVTARSFLDSGFVAAEGLDTALTWSMPVLPF